MPRTSFYNYYYNTQWSQFVKLIEFEEDYDFFYLNGDYTLGGEHGTITGDPDVELNPGSGLIIEGDSMLHFGNINYTINGSTGASIVSDGNLSADTLSINIMAKGQWHFLTFPYNIDRSDIHCSSEFVIREYDGATRAGQGSGGWKNVPTGVGMINGKGYIFQSKNDDTLRLVKPNPVFVEADFTYPLYLYPATNPWDANWNMIGNPYISYYDLDSLVLSGFSYPVIVWNGKGYDTYRPGDDTYHFTPLEGFFVQNAALSQITFKASGRETRVQANEKRNKKYQAMPARTAESVMQQERLLVNLTLGNSEYTDKTRIVFNNQASTAYEIGVDAAKFLTTEAPVQLYTIGNMNEQYSINERPDNHTTVMLGYFVQKEGTYTLSATRMDTNVRIYDNETRTEVDLSKGDYTFYSQAGMNNTRFGLQVTTEVMTPTNLEDLDVNNLKDVSVYTLLGQCLMQHADMKQVRLSAGTYLIKADSNVTKVIVK